MTRQQERKLYRKAASLTVDQQHAAEPRRARRKIARALAKQERRKRLEQKNSPAG